MRRKGDKVTYCVAFLSARHGVPKERCMRFSAVQKGMYVSCSMKRAELLLSWGEEMNFASET